MGFSLVGAAAIIGVTVLVVMEIIVGTTIPTVTTINDSYKEMKNRSIEQIQTDINITSATAVANGSDHHDLTFVVNNSGSVSLEPADFDVIVNGTKVTFTCTTTYLFPENEATFTVNYVDGRSGSRRLKVITENGIEDYYTYSLT